CSPAHPHLPCFPTRRSSDLYVTNSSPYGMVEPPFDPCDVVKAAGATLVAETTATQWHQTVKIVKKALGNDGFSFVHVHSPCNERSEEHTSELQSRFDLVCRL